MKVMNFCVIFLKIFIMVVFILFIVLILYVLVFIEKGYLFNKSLLLKWDINFNFYLKKGWEKF